MDKEYKKTNRETRMAPKSNTLHWCDYCDRDQVYRGEKCFSCGGRDSGRQLKKDTN